MLKLEAQLAKSNPDNQNDEMLQSIVDDLNEKYSAMSDYTDISNSFYKYVTDVLDVEYRIDRQHRVRSVKLCLAFGGPNIYLDTTEGLVKLHWGVTTVERWISTEICEAIDDIYEGLF